VWENKKPFHLEVLSPAMGGLKYRPVMIIIVFLFKRKPLITQV